MATTMASSYCRQLARSSGTLASYSPLCQSHFLYKILGRNQCISQWNEPSRMTTSPPPCFHQCFRRRDFSSSVTRTRLSQSLPKSRSVKYCSDHSKKISFIGSTPAWKRHWIRQRRKSNNIATNSSFGASSKAAVSSKAKNNGSSVVKSSEEESSQLTFMIDQIKSFGIGSVAGLLGSLAGMGGGFVMIPLMTAARHTVAQGGSWVGALRGGLGLHQHQAHGTSLFAVGTTGLAGALGYGIKITGEDDACPEDEAGRSKLNASNIDNGGENAPQSALEKRKQMQQQGLVELDTAVALAATAMVTARIGAITSTFLSERALQRALGAFMLFVAPLVPGKAYLDAWQDVTHPSDPESQKHLEAEMARHPEHDHLSNLERLLPASFIGLFSGFLSGMFGVGGGAIVVPSLVLSTDMTQHSALGTSLCAMVLPAAVGTYTHFKRGNVAMRVAPMLALGSFVGAFVGGREVGIHLEEDVLRGGFACLMLVLGVKTWRKGGK